VQGKLRQGPVVGLAAVILAVLVAQIASAGGEPGDSVPSSKAELQQLIKKEVAKDTTATTAKKKKKKKRGPTGPPGPPGPPGADGRSALSELRPGETERGVYAERGQAPQIQTGITLPIPAPAPIDSLHVVAIASISVQENPNASACTGSFASPTAAPGFVCLYQNAAAAVNLSFQGGELGYAAGADFSSFFATGDGSRFGFIVLNNAPAAGLMATAGSWAYTAP
jgi:hypothetical protein